MYHITNHANLPDAIVQAVVNDPYPYGKTGDISVTRLIGPPQIRMLERQHRDDIEEDAADRIWALIGQIAHGILERAETVAITEERLFAEVDGWQVSGQFDRLALLPDGTLQDYKVTSTWAVIDGPKTEWLQQLNTLRYLATRNGYKVEKLQIVAILRDWSKGKARQGGNYPPVQVRVIDVPVWPMARTEDYVRERVRLHQLAETCAETGRALPECTSEERWERPTKYAVRKPGRKSAVRLYDDQAAAWRHASEVPNGYVETRAGASIRCADYCPVAEFCAQRAMTLAQQEAAAA